MYIYILHWNPANTVLTRTTFLRSLGEGRVLSCQSKGRGRDAFLCSSSPLRPDRAAPHRALPRNFDRKTGRQYHDSTTCSTVRSHLTTNERVPVRE